MRSNDASLCLTWSVFDPGKLRARALLSLVDSALYVQL